MNNLEEFLQYIRKIKEIRLHFRYEEFKARYERIFEAVKETSFEKAIEVSKNISKARVYFEIPFIFPDLLDSFLEEKEDLNRLQEKIPVPIEDLMECFIEVVEESEVIGILFEIDREISMKENFCWNISLIQDIIDTDNISDEERSKKIDQLKNYLETQWKSL